jgi:hypothetical protein
MKFCEFKIHRSVNSLVSILFFYKKTEKLIFKELYYIFAKLNYILLERYEHPTENC